MNFQDIILTLQNYWAAQGCNLIQPYDVEMGAGTFHPGTFFGALGPKPVSIAYPQPCRRPKDGRYGENPNRLQHYYQFQVLIKPSPENIQNLYLKSLQAIGIEIEKHDIRFVEDDWESPTLGAWGLGWEVWLDGMEISQFTYFQQVAGIDTFPVSVELTYGLERLAMYIQDIDDYRQLKWNDSTLYEELFLPKRSSIRNTTSRRRTPACSSACSRTMKRSAANCSPKPSSIRLTTICCAAPTTLTCWTPGA